MKVLAHLSILAIAISAAATSSADGFTVSGAKKMTVTASKLASAKKKATVGSIGLDKKSLTFNGSSIQLVVETGPKTDMMSYRVQGLRNPSLMVKAGATLHILFVNTDDDMFHSLRFTTKRAPFDAKIGSKGSVGSSDLAHMSTKSFFGQEFTLKVPMKKGMYRYVCTTAGHAAAGMYGTITVR
jgi:rusticyanin